MKGESIMKFVSQALLILIFSWTIALAPIFAAERSFYQGKNVNFIINFAAGGPTDIEGRIVARHLAKHIPGNPTIIVQNMAGAGGVTGINFLGEAAKRDGLTMGYFTGPYNHQMMKSASLRTDLMKVPFIASVGSVTVCYIRSDVPPGIKKPTDIAKRSVSGPAACLSTVTRISVSGSPSTFLGSSTITSPGTTAAATRGWRCSATKFSIMMKTFLATAASSNRN